MRLALEESGISIDNELMSAEDLWSGREAFSRLINNSNPPTAIFCASDRLARTVMEAASEMQIPVPQKLSIVGFDDEPWSSQCSPSLTTVNIFPDKMALAAVEKMLGMINNTTILCRSVTPAELIVRESSGPAPKVG